MKIVKDREKLIVPAIPVEEKDIVKVDRMLMVPMLTYLKDKAVGLAHSQVNFGDGPNLRAFAIRYYKANVIRVFINPIVTLLDPDNKISHYEECLSLAGSFPTERAERVKIRDLNGLCLLNGMDAVVAQHEIDHLDGILLKNICYCSRNCIESMGQSSCTHDPRWHA